MSTEILIGDSLELLAELQPESVDAIVCDPPYGIGFMGHEWDQPGDHGPVTKRKQPSVAVGAGSARHRDRAARAEGERDHTKTRARSDAMHAGRYDLSQAANRRFQSWCEQWAQAALPALKPGGHLLAFGSPRTYHRLAAGLEDAGFEVRDTIAWLHGQGFPKSHNIGKAIDRRPGVQQHEAFAAHLAEKRDQAGLSRADVSEAVVGARTGACWNWEHHQFPEAKWWPKLAELLDLDPEWEAVIAEATREKIGEREQRSLVIAPGQERDYDPVILDVTAPATEQAREWEGWGTALKPAFEPIVMARKPMDQSIAANVLQHRTGALNIEGCRLEARGVAQTQGAENRDGLTILGAERRDGGKVYAETLGRWPTNVALDPSAVADLGQLAKYFYCPKPSTAERGLGLDARNPHPTVKPVELMRWCVRLVTPPAGRVLDPFLGSGTTAIAAYLEGMEFVGIDREEEYANIARQRVEWWRTHADPGAPTEAVVAASSSRVVDQLGLFGEAL